MTERAIMRTHCDIGYKMLLRIPFLREAAEIVLSHQEYYDGSGYPRGLRGEEIPLGARIFAVADAVDAMTLRPALSQSAHRSSTPATKWLAAAARNSILDVVEIFLSLPESIWMESARERPAEFPAGHFRRAGLVSPSLLALNRR